MDTMDEKDTTVQSLSCTQHISCLPVGLVPAAFFVLQVNTHRADEDDMNMKGPS